MEYNCKLTLHEGYRRRMAESLSFQEMMTQLIASKNIINNQHQESFKSFIGTINISREKFQPGQVIKP